MEMKLRFCPQGHTPNGWMTSETCPTCGEKLGGPQTETEKAFIERLHKRSAALAKKTGDEGISSNIIGQLHGF